MADGLDPRRRVQSHPRPGPEGPDLAQRPMEVRTRLGVHDDELAARLHVAVEQLVGVADHQMSLESHRRPAPASADDVGPEGEVGHEVTVHDIPLDAVDTGLLEGGDLVAEAREVGRED